jgi:hypothetical protein
MDYQPFFRRARHTRFGSGLVAARSHCLSNARVGHHMDQDASDRMAEVAWIYHVKVYFRTTEAMHRSQIRYIQMSGDIRQGCLSVEI